MQTLCFCVAGLIHVGDELKEVNGIPVDDKKPEEIIRILVSLICLFVSLHSAVCVLFKGFPCAPLSWPELHSLFVMTKTSPNSSRI